MRKKNLANTEANITSNRTAVIKEKMMYASIKNRMVNRRIEQQ